MHFEYRTSLPESLGGCPDRVESSLLCCGDSLTISTACKFDFCNFSVDFSLRLFFNYQDMFFSSSLMSLSSYFADWNCELKFYCAYCLIGIDAPPRFPALTSTGIIGNYKGNES
jgi:hypothetical protein